MHIVTCAKRNRPPIWRPARDRSPVSRSLNAHEFSGSSFDVQWPGAPDGFYSKGADMFQIFRATGGGFFWRLKGGNGETICHSEVYTTKQAAMVGIEAVRRIAPSGPVQDLTA